MSTGSHLAGKRNGARNERSEASSQVRNLEFKFKYVNVPKELEIVLYRINNF